MRFAAIADVHGNHLALDAVLADISAQGIADIVNLGDMASGPLDARRTMDSLMALDALHLRGNHDRYLIDRAVSAMGAWDSHAFGQLDATHLDWIRKLPATAIYREQVFCCHATPDSDDVYWLDAVKPDGAVTMAPKYSIAQQCKHVSQRLILCAHTHLARAVRIDTGQLIVNPGSVGIPGFRYSHPYPHRIEAGSPEARYAILDGDGDDWRVTFRLVPYDHAAMAAMARENGQDELADALATGWIS